jgi:hypothetical protein
MEDIEGTMAIPELEPALAKCKKRFSIPKGEQTAAMGPYKISIISECFWILY